MSSAATLFSTARSDHPEHHSGHGGKVFAIKPEWCSASNRNSVRDHRNAVRDQTGTLFGIARIPQRSLVYRTYALDARNESITRALVVVHGAGRDADNYFRTTLAAAFLAGSLDNTIVISPRMASNDGQSCKDTLAPNEISWNCGSWRSGGPSLTSPTVGSFDFLDEILRKVARKDVFPNLKLIVVAGHSAGGQVVNRYEMGNHVHETLGV
jgi:pimeloyl-ACP methyl ester carboxylesterase